MTGCLFCKDNLFLEEKTYPSFAARCHPCNTLYYFHHVSSQPLKIFKYAIFTKYKDKTYSIHMQMDYDDAQLYYHPDNPDDTLVMVLTLTNASSKLNITPSNFKNKLQTLLTFG